jgi:uncharacterized protein YcbX
MHVAELWRYPVKSLKGEQLQQAEITLNGIPGDREIVVLNSAGRVITSRSRPKLLGLRGQLSDDGMATINACRWDSAEAGELVNAAVGEPTKLVRVPQPKGFDVLPLLIATDGATAFLEIDHRRLRPNLLLAGVPGLKERDWPGRIISIGEVRIQAVKLRARCVMTTFDPDTQDQDKSVLVKIIRDLDGTAALDCSVIHAGVVHVGDAVELS